MSHIDRAAKSMVKAWGRAWKWTEEALTAIRQRARAITTFAPRHRVWSRTVVKDATITTPEKRTTPLSPAAVWRRENRTSVSHSKLYHSWPCREKERKSR